MIALTLLCTGFASAAPFVIECEDFDHGGGQHPVLTDVMPYYGGACQGLGGIAEIDYHRVSVESSGDEYRVGEDPNVPLRGVAARGSEGFTASAQVRVVVPSSASSVR